MWKKILFVVLAILVLAAGGIAAWVATYEPESRPAPNTTVAVTPERVERGRYVYTLAACDSCHSPSDETRQFRPVIEAMRGSGQLLDFEGLPGRVYARNITPDLETGLGKWSDGEKIRAIREGISRDGHALFPMMPYGNYRHMSDDDVEALVAYLNTLKPVRNPLPATELDFPVNIFIKGAPRPVNGPIAPVTKSDRAYGEYLATIGSCAECHTPSVRGQSDPAKRLAGGMRFGVKPLKVAVVSANITPDPDTGIGKWTPEYFLERFQRHRNVPVESLPRMTPENFTMMPWLSGAQLTDEDLTAIYNYLRTVTPVSNKVVTHPADVKQ